MTAIMTPFFGGYGRIAALAVLSAHILAFVLQSLRCTVGRTSRDRAITRYEAFFVSPAFSERSILRAPRLAKLLVTPLDQPVITGTRFQTIQVLRHSMKHHLPSLMT